MRTKSTSKALVHRQSILLKSCTIVSAIGLVWTAGCSADSENSPFGPESAGRGGGVPTVKGGTTGAGGAGGAQHGAAAGATAIQSSGGASGSAGMQAGTAGATAGGSNSGSQAGAANPSSGGNAQAGSSQAIAGAATSQGGAGQGGTSAMSGAGGLVGGATGTAICPAYNGTGGVLLTPPSNGFESDIVAWTTMSENPSALSRKQMAPSSCQGSWYLACDGASRGGSWDGPKLMILPYVLPGHEYVVTLAARFDPENAPPTPRALILSTVNACSDASVSTKFKRLHLETTLTDWMRFSGTVRSTLEGCTQLSEVTIYVETDAIDQTYSIDVDDFQLWDVTSATASGGSGGVAGAAGNSSMAGAAGNSSMAGAGGNSSMAGAAGNGGAAGAAM